VKKLPKEDIVKRENELYNSKYLYAKVKYLGVHVKIEIVCP